MKYLSFLAGSLFAQGVLALFMSYRTIISTFLIMISIWLTLNLGENKT